MKMDLGRFPFEAKMRFFADDPTEIDVRWYEAKPDADWFPTWHRFGNGDLASTVAPWPGVGQVPGTRKYITVPDLPVNFAGHHFAGPLHGYQYGTIFPGTPLETDNDGFCVSCGPMTGNTCSYYLQVPDVIFLRVNAAVAFPGPPNVTAGEVITMSRLGPLTNIWFLDRALHDQCGGTLASCFLECDSGTWRLRGVFFPPNVLSDISFPPLSITCHDFQPFEIGTVCPAIDFESWDVTIFSLPPPP